MVLLTECQRVERKQPERRTEEKTKQKGKKTKKVPVAGRFHNYLIYRFLKILLLISRQGSTAGIRKEL